jgi:hypothetical protein
LLCRLKGILTLGIFEVQGKYFATSTTLFGPGAVTLVGQEVETSMSGTVSPALLYSAGKKACPPPVLRSSASSQTGLRRAGWNFLEYCPA